VKVIKHSGHIVDFDSEKLKQSLLKSGAGPSVVDEVMGDLEIYDGITTKKIYKQAFALLKKTSFSNAARYNLRTALQMLGPAGFFFEKFIARIYSSEAYETTNNLILKGKCVSHEIDVALSKDNNVTIIECKFHNNRESNCDVKVPLYVLSRFNDLKENQHSIFSENDNISRCIIVTNNRFTSDATAFANCAGLLLLSWNYPDKDCIRTKIDKNSLYPVTCLTTLSITEKEKLMILDIILVRELINNSACLQKIRISENRIKNVLKEASELCNYL